MLLVESGWVWVATSDSHLDIYGFFFFFFGSCDGFVSNGVGGSPGGIVLTVGLHVCIYGFGFLGGWLACEL